MIQVVLDSSKEPNTKKEAIFLSLTGIYPAGSTRISGAPKMRIEPSDKLAFGSEINGTVLVPATWRRVSSTSKRKWRNCVKRYKNCAANWACHPPDRVSRTTVLKMRNIWRHAYGFGFYP